MKQRWLFVAILVALTLLVVASCSLTSRGSSDQDLSGRMLLWHSLKADEADPLKQVIDSFTALYPNVTVKVQVFSTTAELDRQFINAADAGLGPDLVLAPSESVPALLAAQSLAPIDAYLNDTITARFNPAILATLQADGQTYGLPQSLDTMGLFVNRQVVETPATNLPSLLEQADSGTAVLVPINFVDAFWGLRAFGGQLFNDEGMALLDQGAFANWLTWLRDARGAPGMIQDTNREVLRQRFMAGDSGYYFGYASELNQILSTLDPASLETYQLPMGPVGRAGPLVTSRAFLFSSVSSDNQRLLATELAKFVTNAEQSSRLMRLAHQVPANISVRINPRLYPMVASLVAQARNGMPKPLTPSFETAIRLGNEAYVRTLEGGESPAEAAFFVNNSVNVANGFELQDTRISACRNFGTMRLLVKWQGEAQLTALDSIIDAFQTACPLVIVQASSVSPLQIEGAMTAAMGAGGSAVVSLVDRQQLADLQRGTPGLLNLDATTSNQVLQRFAPIAVEAMRINDKLYGLPFTMDVDALYYNQDLIATPAQTLDDLRRQSNAGVPIALDTNFERAFWGMSTFGTQLFAPSGAAILDQGGMAEWLKWLLESRDSHSIQLSSDSDALREQFIQGDTAYYVGGADELEALQAAMGEKLHVTILPSGPGGLAQPLVRVEGLAVRADASAVDQSLMLDFMHLVTDLPSQNKLVAEANIIPVNGSVSIANDPFMSIFFDQAQTGYLLPSLDQSAILLELGPEAYAEVLNDGRDANEVVGELTASINEANGIDVTPSPLSAPTAASTVEVPTPEAGIESTPYPDQDDDSENSGEENRAGDSRDARGD